MKARELHSAMETTRVVEILEAVKAGDMGTTEALELLRRLPFEDLGFARIDGHRALRRGFPEVVYSPGKTQAQILEILTRLDEAGDRALATRVAPERAVELLEALPRATYHGEARMLTLGAPPGITSPGFVAVLSAGTSDIPVAEEAALTARWAGSRVRRIHDVGVAGLHRLLAHLEELASARVIVVAAGMDGALPAVVSGLVQAPVIAVPTSVGYGIGAGGIAPLLTMLNTCSPGVAVVNIDNGFGAGYLAGTINRMGADESP